MYLLKLRRAAQLFALVLIPAAAATAGGFVVDQDALKLDVTRHLPAPGTGDAGGVQIGIRNRLAVVLPVRGSRLQPAWMLERRTRSGAWQPIPAKSSSRRTMEHLTCLLPFQRASYEVAVDRPGTFRVVAYSGRFGKTRHVSPTVSFGIQDFDHPPFAL